MVNQEDRNFKLFIGGLEMVLGLTKTAITILEYNLQGVVGLFFGIEQWSIVISFYITAHERSLVRHKDTVTEQGAKLANHLTIPLIKNMETLRDMCREGRSVETLMKLGAFESHLTHLIQKPRDQLTQWQLREYRDSVIESEFPKIMQKLQSSILDHSWELINGICPSLLS
jgi:hypothetical protein